MSSGLLNSLRWCLSLASKFKRVVFWPTSFIVLLTLASQISMILAFFLPLKVVILLGSVSVPGYFPEFLEVLGRDILIVAISLSAVVFYAVHLISERLIIVVTDNASGKVLLHNRKVVLFQNQDVIAKNAYRRISRVLAGSVFICLTLFAISFFYPDMALLLLCYVLGWGASVGVLLKSSRSFQEKLRNKPQGAAELFAGVGFFIAFIYLVIDFTFLTPPSVMVAVLSVLLCRQLFGRFSGIVSDLYSLSSQRVKIDALFFHKKVLLPNQVDENSSYWPFLEPEKRSDWVDSIIRASVEGWGGCQKISWHSSSSPGVAVLFVEGVAESGNYFIKIYEKKYSNLAMHESTLLGESLGGLPSPSLIGVSSVSGFTCQVYRLPFSELPSFPQDARAATVWLRTELLKVDPPDELCDKYLRSKALLWQRLNESDVKKINIAVATEEQAESVSAFLDCLPEIKSILRALPLVFINPDLRPVNMFASTQSSDVFLVNWGRWSLEPIGVGFGGSKGEIMQIGKVLHEAASVRHRLRGIDAKAVEMAALVSVLEERCGKHQLNEALDLVLPILERFKALSFGSSLREAHPEAL
ncbi:hypothetical protein [Microbulbifer sp. M83]|uniref:hypothetical protein n=1 Tax=Microbulbifer sp. M83 TaxID=3118246 RepID=UPI002FE41130